MSRVRWMALSTSLGVTAAGVLTVISAPTATASADAASPATIHVHVTKTHSVLMTNRMHPGMHKFRIRSGAEAGFQLIRPDHGYTKAEAARDANRGFGQGNTNAMKRLERHLTFVGGANTSPGHPAVMWADLTRGRYWAVDTNPATTRASKFLTVRVGGSRVAGRVQGTSVIRAIHETEWAPRPSAIKHFGRLTFRNNSKDNHFVILAKLANGKTMQDFRQWIKDAMNGGQTPPPLMQGTEIDTGVVSPGHAMTIKYSLPRGRYVLTCFWPDADMGGMPHAFMGMYRGIRLR